MTILCDVLRWGKSNLYGDKICNIFSLIVFALRFSRLILTLIFTNIPGPFTSFFVYCIIRKLHDKITTDYAMLMGLCKKHQDKYGFDTWSSCLARGAWKVLLVDE